MRVTSFGCLVQIPTPIRLVELLCVMVQAWRRCHLKARISDVPRGYYGGLLVWLLV